MERKIEARIQNRVGPMVAGPAGILQPLADFIKLLTKEDIEPRDAKKTIFKFAPLVAFAIMMFRHLLHTHLPAQASLGRI